MLYIVQTKIHITFIVRFFRTVDNHHITLQPVFTLSKSMTNSLDLVYTTRISSTPIMTSKAKAMLLLSVYTARLPSTPKTTDSTINK